MTNDADGDPPENDDVTAPGADLGPDQGEMRERRASGRRGRRGGAPSVVTIGWRDIPAQLTARAGGEQQKVLLHARFQHAIDRAAAVAGLTTTNDYVQEWRSTPSPLADGDVAAQLDQLCAELESDYPRDRLEALVANGGLEPSSGDGRASDPDSRSDTSDAPVHPSPDTSAHPPTDTSAESDTP